MIQLIEEQKIDASTTYFTDLNDSKVFISEYKDKPVIIIGGAQKAAKESEKWGKAIKSSCNDCILLNIAFIPKQPPASIILSIKNQLKRAFGKIPFLISWGTTSNDITLTNEELTHIFFIDRQGYLRIKFAEKYSESNLSKLLESIHKFV